MSIGVGYYTTADSFISLRAANHQEDIVWTTAQQDTFGGMCVTPQGELANPIDGNFGGICVHKFVPEGKPLPFVPNGPVENDDWSNPFGGTSFPEATGSDDYKCFLDFGGKLALIPPPATYLLHVGTICDPQMLNVNSPLKVKLF